ncbi:MAG: transglutaminase family protein [Mogibacterium sp.]|nr:transglutaminase family protein [Mogibacterium sp.]
MQLSFSYHLTLDFSEPVEDQYFSFLCLPRETARQRVLSLTTEVRPAANLSQDADGSGNPQLYGVVRAAHRSFDLAVSGTVETGAALYEEYQDPADVTLVRYLVPSRYTEPGPALRALYEAAQLSAPAEPYDKLLYYSNCVRESLRYVPASTDVRTAAEDAVRLGTGVCQDYAHVLTALLRMAGVPARYVVGIMQGEGESHAWVEANCRGYWYGIDPTNNTLLTDGYIKFAHGRDYADCMISRGVFRNPRAEQSATVTATVTPL